MSTFLLKKFNEIKDLLPSDCWASTRNALNKNEFDNEYVLFYEGDLTLDSLDFDHCETLAPTLTSGETIFLILVTGNLNIKQFIYNKNTDGATGLVVVGNLQAQNILVGGQEVYVAGNMNVSELFWGDYNHGDLTVKGDVAALVFADTEQYHVNINGAKNFSYHLTNYDEVGDWQNLDSGLIAAMFDDVLYFEDVSDDDDSEGDLINVLHRGDTLLNHLQVGKSLLLSSFIKNGYTPAKNIEPTYADLTQLASVQRIREILNLPYILEKYPDYNDGDRNGYWHNNLRFCFRQKSADATELIYVSKEIKSETQAFDCNMFHFGIEINEAGVEVVTYAFQAHNGFDQTPVPFSVADKALVQQACQRFKALMLCTKKHQQDYQDLQKELSATGKAAEKKKVKQKPYARSHLECNGVTFKVITLREADAYLSDLNWGTKDDQYNVAPFPYPPDEGYYLLAEEDVVCEKFDANWEDAAENLHVAGFIFLKNLTSQQYLMSFDLDVSPFFVVLGNLKAVNIGLWGNTHYVGGNLDANLLYGKYNHGSLFVRGHATCFCVVSDDFEMFFGDLNTYAIVDEIGRIKKTIEYKGENGEALTAVLAYPATHGLDEVFIDSIYVAEDDGGYGGHYVAVCENMQANTTCIDMQKIQAPIAHFRANVTHDFEQLFKHAHFKTENSWMSYPYEHTTDIYFFANQSESGTLSIAYKNKHYCYKKMVMLSPKKGLKKLLGKGAEIDLYLDYYEQDNDTEKLGFALTPDEICLEAFQVIYAFRCAIKHFSAQK